MKGGRRKGKEKKRTGERMGREMKRTVVCSMQGETDEQYLRKVADVMHSLFGTHGATLLPLFDQLLPTLRQHAGQ